jgi:phospholipase/lecithinase/hemolysin
MCRPAIQPVRSVAACLLAAGAILLAAPAASAQPAQIVVFGDSLSDPGNGFVFVREPATPPDYGLNALLIPSAPYARGGHHLTNGATWIEQLARPLGLARSVRPAFQSSNPHAMNFAIGTARARDDGTNPSLSLQVAAFLQKAGGVAGSDALYVIQIGTNDVRDALAAAAIGSDPLPILQTAAASIAGNITTLYAAGARQFLVWNVPDIGLTPAVAILDAQLPGTAALATLMTQVFNALLSTELAALLPLPGITIVPFDAFALVSAIHATPGQFGLTNVTDACLTPDVPPFACRNPDEFLFWDGIHPTHAVHAIIAAQVAALLAW